jgi:hypothetical protein
VVYQDFVALPDQLVLKVKKVQEALEDTMQVL